MMSQRRLCGILLSLVLAFLTSCHAAAAAACQGYPQNLTAPSGDIKSPNFPDSYDANQHCVWNISVADRTGLHVELKFLKFNISGSMPDCESGDYLEVFLGSGFDSIGRFCGGISPPTVYSPDGCMKLVFHSDGKTSNVGFHAAYSLRPLNQAISNATGGCGVGIKENVKQGVILSPRWPLHYPQYVDCVWEVSSRKNMNLKLSFYNFEVLQQSPCGEYLIDVRSGVNGFRYATRLLDEAKECGKKQPFSIHTTSNTLYIHFTSGNLTDQHRGFAAGYVAYEIGEAPFSSQVLIVFAILFVVMVLFGLKMLLKKLCKSKSCTCANLCRMRMRLRRSNRVFPESPAPPVAIGKIRVHSAPLLHESTASFLYCEQCAAEGNLGVTRPDTWEKRSHSRRPSTKSVQFAPSTPAKKRPSPRPQ